MKAIDDDEVALAGLFLWLADLKPFAMHITRNEHKPGNFCTAAVWISMDTQDYSDVDPDEIERMKETDTIWDVQVYPEHSVTSYITRGATLVRALAEMRATLAADYPNGFNVMKVRNE